MLGSVHDAEDLVQETYLRAGAGTGVRGTGHAAHLAVPDRDHGMSARAGKPCSPGAARRRGLARGRWTGQRGDGHEWLEPIPDANMFETPEDAVAARQSVRLAVMTALQELPARQRAVLILRDVVQFSAAEVAELLRPRPQRSTARCSGPAPTLPRSPPPKTTSPSPNDGGAAPRTARTVLRGIRKCRHGRAHRTAARRHQARDAA